MARRKKSEIELENKIENLCKDGSEDDYQPIKEPKKINDFEPPLSKQDFIWWKYQRN